MAQRAGRIAREDGRTLEPLRPGAEGPHGRVRAVAFVRSGMAGGDVAEMLGVSSAAVACNPAGAAENPSRAAADRSPVVVSRKLA